MWEDNTLSGYIYYFMYIEQQLIVNKTIVLVMFIELQKIKPIKMYKSENWFWNAQTGNIRL